MKKVMKFRLKFDANLEPLTKRYKPRVFKAD